MNRSIQAEGTFGVMKNDRWYKRIVRRGIKSVQLEVILVSIGQNLYKFYKKQKNQRLHNPEKVWFYGGKGNYVLFYREKQDFYT